MFSAACQSNTIGNLYKIWNKGIPNGFPCGIGSSMHAGCCETFGKRKKSRAAASAFLCFPKVEQQPKCTDDAILHGKTFGNCFIK